jgi:cytochrome c-type biogenesis protein CcmH/NrfF
MPQLTPSAEAKVLLWQLPLATLLLVMSVVRARAIAS